MRMSNFKILLGVLTIVVLVLLAGIANLSPPTRPDVSVALIGYTNNVAGVPLAVFAVTNRGHSMVYLYKPMTDGEVYTRSNWPSWHSMLDGGSSATLSLIHI